MPFPYFEFGIPVAIQKRLIRFILKRVFGKYLSFNGQLNSSSDVTVSSPSFTNGKSEPDAELKMEDGKFTLSEIELNLANINEALSGVGIKVQKGTINRLSLDLPDWKQLMNDKIAILINDLNLEILLCYSNRDTTDTKKTWYSNFLMDEILKDEYASQAIHDFNEKGGEPVDEDNNQGISTLAFLMNRFLQRISIEVKNVTIQLSAMIDNNEKPERMFVFNFEKLHFIDSIYEPFNESTTTPNTSELIKILKLQGLEVFLLERENEEKINETQRRILYSHETHQIKLKFNNNLEDELESNKLGIECVFNHIRALVSFYELKSPLIENLTWIKNWYQSLFYTSEPKDQEKKTIPEPADLSSFIKSPKSNNSEEITDIRNQKAIENSLFEDDLFYSVIEGRDSLWDIMPSVAPPIREASETASIKEEEWITNDDMSYTFWSLKVNEFRLIIVFDKANITEKELERDVTVDFDHYANIVFQELVLSNDMVGVSFFASLQSLDFQLYHMHNTDLHAFLPSIEWFVSEELIKIVIESMHIDRVSLGLLNKFDLTCFNTWYSTELFEGKGKKKKDSCLVEHEWKSINVQLLPIESVLLLEKVKASHSSGSVEVAWDLISLHHGTLVLFSLNHGKCSYQLQYENPRETPKSGDSTELYSNTQVFINNIKQPRQLNHTSHIASYIQNAKKCSQKLIQLNVEELILSLQNIHKWYSQLEDIEPTIIPCTMIHDFFRKKIIKLPQIKDHPNYIWWVQLNLTKVKVKLLEYCTAALEKCHFNFRLCDHFQMHQVIYHIGDIHIDNSVEMLDKDLKKQYVLQGTCDRRTDRGWYCILSMYRLAIDSLKFYETIRAIMEWYQLDATLSLYTNEKSKNRMDQLKQILKDYRLEVYITFEDICIAHEIMYYYMQSMTIWSLNTGEEYIGDDKLECIIQDLCVGLEKILSIKTALLHLDFIKLNVIDPSNCLRVEAHKFNSNLSKCHANILFRYINFLSTAFGFVDDLSDTNAEDAKMEQGKGDEDILVDIDMDAFRSDVNIRTSFAASADDIDPNILQMENVLDFSPFDGCIALEDPKSRSESAINKGAALPLNIKENYFEIDEEKSNNNNDNNDSDTHEWKFVLQIAEFSVKLIEKHDFMKILLRNIKIYHTSIGLPQLKLKIKDVMIEDGLLSSTWKSFLIRNKNRANIKDSMVRMDCIGIKNPSTDHENGLEYRLSINILPIRCFIDQDALKFLMDFYIYVVPSSRSRIAYGSLPRTRTRGIYFQYVNISSMALVIDYKPKEAADIPNLIRNYGYSVDLLQFFNLENCSVALPRLELVGGCQGRFLFQSLLELYGRQSLELQSQLWEILRSLAPIKSTWSIVKGIKDIIIYPMESLVSTRNSSRGERLVRGLKKGSLSFWHNTAVTGLQLSSKTAVGTSKILRSLGSYIDDDVVHHHSPSAALHQQSSKKEVSEGLLAIAPRSPYANPPENLQVGLNQALQSLTLNLHDALHSYQPNILPITTPASSPSHEQRVAKEGLDSLRNKKEPSTSTKVAKLCFKPVLGASEALSKTLLGAYSAVSETNEYNEKYK